MTRMRIGSGTQYGSVHDRATPRAAAAPRTAAKATAVRAVMGSEYRSPCTTGGAPNRRAMTMPYAVPIATMAPKVNAVLPVDTGVTNVAAKGRISRAPNQPPRNPAPATAPVAASSATHHQSYAV